MSLSHPGGIGPYPPDLFYPGAFAARRGLLMHSQMQEKRPRHGCERCVRRWSGELELHGAEDEEEH